MSINKLLSNIVYVKSSIAGPLWAKKIDKQTLSSNCALKSLVCLGVLISLHCSSLPSWCATDMNVEPQPLLRAEKVRRGMLHPLPITAPYKLNIICEYILLTSIDSWPSSALLNFSPQLLHVHLETGFAIIPGVPHQERLSFTIQVPPTWQLQRLWQSYWSSWMGILR